jgi:predicted DNA-binding ArsR family transcriptional regulator
MGTPAEFCQNARECLDLAKHTNNEVHRKMLLDLAAKWLHLAGVTRHEIGLIKGADKQSAA